MENPLLQDNTLNDLLIDKRGSIKLQYRYNANIIDRLFYGWIYPMIRYSRDNIITQDILQDLSSQQQSQFIYNKWIYYWNEQKGVNNVDPLMQSIKNNFKNRYILGTIFDFLSYQSTILTPVFVYFITMHLQDNYENVGWSVFYLILIPVIRFTRSFFDGHASFNLNLIGIQIANSISIGMVNKAMRYSVLCNKAFKLGQISSLMQVDCFRLALLPKAFNAIVFICYCIIFAIVFMAIIVQYSFAAGFGVLFVISVINMFISKFTARYQKQFALATDNRMKITNQVFNNIKFIKVNAWEEYFYDKLMSRRTIQIDWLRKKMLAQSCATFTLWLIPKYILVATFGLYIAVGNPLSPEITFSIMLFFSYISFYLQFLPNSISITLQSFNAIKRIQKFLLAEQIDTSYITYGGIHMPSSSLKQTAIEVQNGNFYWDQDSQQKSEFAPKQTDLNLIDINFSIKRGEFVAIIGGIGAGKSSLMYSLLGQMKYKANLPKPKVQINGSLSLVTQKPWIVNDTVRNNIVFGERFDSQHYRQVIKYACLERDFQLFTHGDQTMIGEKGATLSGGQKARISFARSLYSNSDILMLDDLLSAVDVHVGKFMMTETLLKYMKSKTRILITHALYYLKYVDKVLIIEDGMIVEQGTYEVIKSGKRFRQIYASMMKDDKKKKKKNTEGVDLEMFQEDIEMQPDQEAEQGEIQQQIIRQASIHSKKSKTQSAIDRTKLQALRQKKTGDGASKKQAKVQAKVVQNQTQTSNANELMMAEQQTSGASALGLYSSFVRYNLGWGYLILILFIQLVWMFCNSLTNLWLVKWSDSFQIKSQYSQTVFVGGYIIIGFFYAFFALVRTLLVAFSSPRMSNTIHESMISNLLFSSLNQFFDRVPLGRIFNRVSKDLNSVDTSISVYFNSTLVFTFFLGSMIFTIAFLVPNYIFLPAIAIYLLLCHILRIYYSKPCKQLTKLQGITKSPIVSCFTQILSGVSTIRCYKKQQMFLKNNCLKIDQNKKTSMGRRAVQVWFVIRLMVCAYVIVITALVYALFFTGDYNPAERASTCGLLMVVAVGYDQVLFFLLNNMGALESQLISIERCESFMNLQPQAGYSIYLKNRQYLKQKSKQRRALKADSWPNKGQIQFIDFKCRYRKNLDLVLRGLNFTFTGGHKIGVVGRTGSGKSTIMLCLLRILQADSGKIILDGRDISQLSLDDLRSKISIILQDSCLFAGTIRQNLDPLQEYPDSQLLRALQICALKETMGSRQGLETQISENGQNLSAGERQLIGIARAVLKPSKIVLVDEATANIDVTTQAIIYKAMNESFKNSTVITIAHRLNTVINSDRILVLEGGLLKEFDNPQQLLKNPNSFFAQLWNQSQKQSKM